LPAGLGNLPKLEIIAGSENQLSGTLPADLTNSASLEAISLDFNFIEGTVPAFGANNLKLSRISFDFNLLEGPLPSFTGSRLQSISLGRNAISGALPPEWASLPLQSIILFDNEFGGTLPPEWGGLSELSWLSLGGNQLEGTIPAEYANLQNMRRLQLFRNNLGGPIPPWLGTLPALEEVNLTLNQFSGELPVEFNQMLQREYRFFGPILGFGGNQLSGTIPPELGDFFAVPAVFAVWGNNLHGQVPLPVAAMGVAIEQFGFPFFYCDLSSNNPTLSMPANPEYEALTNPPGGPICFLELATFIDILSGIAAAIDLLESGASLSPGDACQLQALLDQATSLVEQGLFEKAIQVLFDFNHLVDALLAGGDISRADAQILLDTNGALITDIVNNARFRVPTLGTWGLIVLTLLVLGVAFTRRQRFIRQ
jgi:hypothetical protein